MRYVVSLIAVAQLVWLSSCAKLDGLDNPPQESSDVTIASVAVFNAVAASTGMDVFFDGDKVGGNDKLISGGYIAYHNHYAGSKNLRIVSRYGNKAQDTYTRSVDLSGGNFYSLFVTKGNNGLEVVPVIDNDVIKPGTGYAKIRIAHMSKDAGELYVIDDKGKKLIGNNLKFKGVSGFVEISTSSSMTLSIAPVLSEKNPQLQNVKLEDGAIYTLLILGYVHADTEGETVNLKLVKH